MSGPGTRVSFSLDRMQSPLLRHFTVLSLESVVCDLNRGEFALEILQDLGTDA